MVTFLVCFALLVAAYFVYGRYLEKLVGAVVYAFELERLCWAFTCAHAAGFAFFRCVHAGLVEPYALLRTHGLAGAAGF